ncbi:MAG: hypothetical protein RIC89_22190 [Pseudomonadales bacterium]
MNSMGITNLEQELAALAEIIESKREAVASSDVPHIEEIFLTSAQKRKGDVEKALQMAKADRASESVHIRLHATQLSMGTISLRYLARLSALLNAVLERASWRVWDKDGQARKIDEKFTRLIDLRLADLRSGSTELTILGNIAPDLTGSSALEEGLSNLLELFQPSNDEFAHHLNALGNDATRSLAELVTFFEKENIAAEFNWPSPSGARRWDARPDEITRVRALLDECDDPVVSKVRVTGVVRVLSVRGRMEILDLRTEEKLTLGYHRDLSEVVNKLHLGETRVFHLDKTVYPFKGSGKKKDSYRIEKIV